MAIVQISNSAPKYTTLSIDDLSAIRYIGAKIYLTDKFICKIVNSDLTLSDYPIETGDYVGAAVTIDSRRHYVHEGKAYNIDFYDNMSANAVYTFYGVNTGNKKIHIDAVYFNPGNFLLEVVDNGVYTSSGSAYTMQTTVEAPSFNLNKGSDNVATFKVYPQPTGLVRTGGTVFAREYNQSSSLNNLQWIINPGQSFTAQFKNLSASAVQYFLRMVWYEVD